MNPSPAELAKGIRTLLREIAPEVGSPEALAKLRRAMFVLRDADWDNAAFALMRENAALARMLAQLGCLSTASPPPTSYAEAAEINRGLRTALAAEIEGLANHPLEDSAALRRSLAKACLALRR